MTEETEPKDLLRPIKPSGLVAVARLDEGADDGDRVSKTPPPPARSPQPKSPLPRTETKGGAFARVEALREGIRVDTRVTSREVVDVDLFKIAAAQYQTRNAVISRYRELQNIHRAIEEGTHVKTVYTRKLGAFLSGCFVSVLALSSLVSTLMYRRGTFWGDVIVCAVCVGAGAVIAFGGSTEVKRVVT